MSNKFKPVAEYSKAAQKETMEKLVSTIVAEAPMTFANTLVNVAAGRLSILQAETQMRNAWHTLPPEKRAEVLKSVDQLVGMMRTALPSVHQAFWNSLK